MLSNAPLAEVFARDASSAHQRIRLAGFPAHKTLEDFDFTAQPSAEKPLLLHLAQLTWLQEHANVCLIGPPGTGKTHLAIALAIKACQAGHRVAFAKAAQDRNHLAVRSPASRSLGAPRAALRECRQDDSTEIALRWRRRARWSLGLTR